MIDRTLPGLALLATFAFASPARANMAAVQYDPGSLLGPATARETPLEVVEERLSFDCSRGPAHGDPACDFEARYLVRNPTSAREVVAAAFYGVYTVSLVVTIDGAAAPAAPQAALPAIDAAAAKVDRVPGPGERRGQAARGVSFTLAAEPGSRHEIVVKGRAAAGARWTPESYSMAAANARHVLFGGRQHWDSHYDLEYLISPIRSWKGDPRIEVRVTHPRDLEVTGSERRTRAEGSGAPAPRPWRHEAPSVESFSLRASEADALTLTITEHPSPFHRGGPLLAIGGTTGPHKGARGRIGYEVAAPSWMLYGLSADTDFRRRFILAPTVEAATPAVIILPSLGLGAGVPIQIAPERRVGARIQGDLHFYPVGFVTSVDVYPRFGGMPGFTEVSLLGQVSL